MISLMDIQRIMGRLRYSFLVSAFFFTSSCQTFSSGLNSTLTPEELVGEWVLGCVSNSKTNPDRAFMTSSDVFDSQSLVSEVKFFKDDLCEQPGNPKIRKLEVSVSFPEGSTATKYGEAKYLNASIKRIEYDGVEFSGKSKESRYELKGRLIHDIYLVKDGVLLFGVASKKYDGSTGKKRFKNVKVSHQYYRK